MEVPIEPVDYAKHGLRHPGLSYGTGVTGTLGLFAVALLSGIGAPIVGIIVAPIQAIKIIWNTSRLQIITNERRVAKRELALANEQRIKANENFDIAQPEAEQEIINLTRKITRLSENKTELKISLKGNKQKFIAATFSLIPFLGIFAAGAYLKATSPEVKEGGLRGVAEAIMQTIVSCQTILLQGMLYPIRGQTMAQRKADPDYKRILEWHENRLRELKAEPVEIPVNRGDTQGSLAAMLIPAENEEKFDPNKPAMVLFHGNGMTMEGMSAHAALYCKLGFNVMILTMGGYPGSDPKVRTSEISTYQDAHAAIVYLKQKGVKDIGVHGTSIGGTLAFAAAEIHPEVVKFVVADQTLGSARDVAANVTRNVTRGTAPASLIRGAIGGAFPAGKVVPGVIGPNGKPYVTDGLNNIRKAAVLRERADNGKENCEIFAIKSERDFFMGRKGNENGGFEENFADDLILARYGELQPEKIHAFNRGHMDWYPYYINLNNKNELQNLSLSKSLMKVFFPESGVQAGDQVNIPIMKEEELLAPN